MDLYYCNQLKLQLNGRIILNLPKLHIKPGKVYGIVGPNGSGKTTLLKLLDLLYQPTSGQISFRENLIKPSKKIQSFRSEMAMVPQKPLYFSSMNVETNILYGLKMRRIKKSAVQSYLNQLIEELDLASLLKMEPQKLSGGEWQRVSIARAWIVQPLILFLDEPFSYLDQKYTPILINKIMEEKKDPTKTMFLSAHQKENIQSYVDHFLYMDNGQLSEE